MKKLLLILMLLNRTAYAQVTDSIFLSKLKQSSTSLSMIVVLTNFNNIPGHHLIIENPILQKYFRSRADINKSMTYKSFLSAVLQQKVTFDCNSFKSAFRYASNKSNLWQEFDDCGLDYLIEKYLENINGRLSTKDGIEKDICNNLISLMFQNGYLISHSKYRGCYYFDK